MEHWIYLIYNLIHFFGFQLACQVSESSQVSDELYFNFRSYKQGSLIHIIKTSFF